MAVYTAIDNPELYMQVKLYTGNGTDNTAYTFDGDEDMQPDLLWFKERNSTSDHALWDSVRGTNKKLEPSTTQADSTEDVVTFDSDGFSVDDHSQINQNTITMVCWAWKANGSGSANEDGTINTTSTSANTTAGFSINAYVGNATSSQTVGHGLGVVPHMIISKNRDNSSTHYNDWVVYHHSNATANDKKLKLNTDDAVSTTNEWGDADPTSSVYSVHTSGDGATNDGTDKIVSYVWTSVQGFSSIGYYTGNGSTDGPFIYTGFRPAWIMYKRTTDGSEGWVIQDNKVSPTNVSHLIQNANSSGAETDSSNANLDFLSNGFKLRHNDTRGNTSGKTYIYMAFAEAPFVNSNGVPCNAR